MNIFKKQKLTKYDKTQSKQISWYFIRCSLDSIKDLSIMQLGDRPTKKSKKNKTQKNVSLYENNQF